MTVTKFVCTSCDREFSSQSELAIHARAWHEPSQKESELERARRRALGGLRTTPLSGATGSPAPDPAEASESLEHVLLPLLERMTRAVEVGRFQDLEDIAGELEIAGSRTDKRAREGRRIAELARGLAAAARATADAVAREVGP